MRVMFSAANCLIDPSSGAAISIRTIFRLLGQRGVVCKSLTGSIFDRAESSDNVQNLRRVGARPTDPGAPLVKPWRFEEAGVEHVIIPLARNARALQTRDDEERLFAAAERMLAEFRPDILISYGAGLFEKSLVERAQSLGIGTVFYLANPGYKNLSSFAGIDQVVFDTEATKALYQDRLGLDGVAIGKFIEPPILPPDAPRDRVLFVNPSAEKGVTLFFRIAELAHEVVPDLRFLVVESRTTLAMAEQRTGMGFSRMPNIERVGLQNDMGAVFARTRILLQPSLWHESGARSAIEAMSLGIPVVATDRGGIPEVMGEAGILIPPPKPMIDNHWLIPPKLMVMDWVEALRLLTEDADFYADHVELARAAWRRHDPTPRIDALIALFERVKAARQPA
jgi:glycosyltransferase involved in cell wall biosynthesis